MTRYAVCDCKRKPEFPDPELRESRMEPPAHQGSFSLTGGGSSASGQNSPASEAPRRERMTI